MEPRAFGSGEVAHTFFRPSAAEEARERKAAEAALDKVIAPLNLVRSSEYPLTGFWMRECTDFFGLAIAPAAGEGYSISFCGPGGCSELRKTRIENDSDFRILDNDSIEMNGQSGFIRWVRCR
jgi:hypothetical protein